mmetsp:Transcript_7862/g.21233  ORF Transcript_7862/g.21233 Transcript_7862/m.21233 type:complete len:201 (-) Transcript_7862:267-869(-)
MVTMLTRANSGSTTASNLFTTVAVLAFTIVTLSTSTTAFVLVPSSNHVSSMGAAAVVTGRYPLTSHILHAEDDDGASQQQQQQPPMDARKRQELIMEEQALAGARKIAQMGIPERAKRAMLAEVLEDQIFANTEQLEQMVGHADLEENRDAAVELAKQTKQLQIQYQELVSGESSSVLEALMTATGGNGLEDGLNEDSLA